MWTVVGKLSEDCLRKGIPNDELDIAIEDSHAFNAHRFAETWRRPTLRHRELTRLVQQQVSFGLGTRDEILLCMIPAFSSKDLLPNHALLQLIPRIGPGQGWTETAQCYNNLLDQNMRASEQYTERFCYNALVATIDFLLFASEPYDDFISAPSELKNELEGIVSRLVSTHFVPGIEKLALAYYLQRRHEDIARIFQLFGEKADAEVLKQCLKALASPSVLQSSFLVRTFGFPEAYVALYRSLFRVADSVTSVYRRWRMSRKFQFQG